MYIADYGAQNVRHTDC